MNAKMVLGHNVKRLRLSCGMIQDDVADYVKTSKAYISNIETGKQWISAAKVEKLCELFAVRMEEFFYEGERLDELNSLLCKEVQQMNPSQRAQLYARALEINSK